MFTLGIVIYAFHFPEAFITRPGHKHWLDRVGGGSHALWHIFIIFGLILWRQGLRSVKAGVPH